MRKGKHKLIQYCYNQILIYLSFIVTICSLLLLGARVDAKDQTGTSPLHSAAAAGHIECIDLLVTNGEFVNVVDTAGVSPVHQVYHPLINTVLIILIIMIGSVSWVCKLCEEIGAIGSKGINEG